MYARLLRMRSAYNHLVKGLQSIATCNLGRRRPKGPSPRSPVALYSPAAQLQGTTCHSWLQMWLNKHTNQPCFGGQLFVNCWSVWSFVRSKKQLFLLLMQLRGSKLRGPASINRGPARSHSISCSIEALPDSYLEAITPWLSSNTSTRASST